MMLQVYLIEIHFGVIDKRFAVPKTIASVSPFLNSESVHFDKNNAKDNIFHHSKPFL